MTNLGDGFECGDVCGHWHGDGSLELFQEDGADNILMSPLQTKAFLAWLRVPDEPRCQKHGAIVETGCPACEAALGRLSVEPTPP